MVNYRVYNNVYVLQVSTSYWLYNGFSGPMITEQLIDYSDILGEIAVPGETQEVERPASGERDGKMPPRISYL